MKPRPFQLLVDSGAHWLDPPTRYFGSLDAALAAAAEYDERFQPHVRVTELREGESNVVHVRNGRRVHVPNGQVTL